MPGPIQLIQYNEVSGKFEVGTAAERLLKGLSGPVSIVTVCGRARQGKSFLLNQLVSSLGGTQSQGFKVSPTYQSCTKGLWMFDTPLVQTDEVTKQRYNMLLVDCEGVDAFDQGSQHSAKIFSLAVLMSSLFIFNQMGAIDTSSIERLSVALELAKRIKAKSSQDPGSEVGHSPSFLWLLRDFQLQLRNEDERQISARDYVEEVLQDVKGKGPDVGNCNQMRQVIKEVFPDRDGFTLVRPVLEESQLVRLDSLPASQLRPEFRKGVSELRSVILRKARPMQLGQQLLSGSAVVGLAHAYVAAINAGAVPQLLNAWQGVVASENQRAQDEAMALYLREYKQSLVEEGAMYAEHQRALDAALQRFSSNALGGPAGQQPHLEAIRKAAGARFHEVRRDVAARLQQDISDRLLKAEQHFGQLLACPEPDVAALQSELRSFLAGYDSQVAGSTVKYQRVGDFLFNTIVGGLQRAVLGARGQRQQAQAQAAQLQAALGKAQAEADAARSSSTELQAALAAAQASLRAQQQAAAQTSSELAVTKQEISSAAAKASALEAQLAASRSREAELQQQVAELRSQQAQASSRIGTAERSLASSQQEAAALRAERSQLSSRVAQLQGDLAAAQSQQSSAQQQATAERQQLLQRLEAEAKVSAAHKQARDVAEAGRAQLQQQLEQAQRSVAELQARCHQASSLQSATSAQLAALQAEGAALQAQVQQLEASRAALQQSKQQLQQQHDQLQQQLQQEAARAASAEAAAPAAQQLIRNLQQQLQQETARASAAEGVAAAAQQQNQDLMQQLQQQTARATSAEAAASAAQQHTHNLQQQLQQESSRISGAQAAAQQQQQQLQQQLQQETARATAAQAAAAAAQQQHQALQQQLQQESSRAAAAEAAAAAAQQHSQSLQQQLQQVSDKLAAAEAATAAARAAAAAPSPPPAQATTTPSAPPMPAAEGQGPSRGARGTPTATPTATATATARKRRRGAAADGYDDDNGEADGGEEGHAGKHARVEDAADTPMPDASASRRGRFRTGSAPMSPLAGGASASTAGGAAQLKEPLPADRSKMTVAAIKKWFTVNDLLDDEFSVLFKDSKASKAKWVEYMERRAAQLGL